MLSEGKLEELVTALRAPSFRQDSAWHHDKVTYSTKPRPLLDEAADTLDALISELRALRAERDASDPTEGLPGKLIAIYTECANGRPINGGDLELIEEAAYRLRAAEAELAALRAQAPDPVAEAAGKPGALQSDGGR